MKKILVVMILGLGIGGYFSYPTIQHHWAIYQLQKKGIVLRLSDIGNVEVMRRLEAENFVVAACGADLEVLRLLLNTRFDVNSKQEDGTTALHCAAAAGQLGQVRLLLDRGANISSRKVGDRNSTDLKFAPIHLAAAWHHMEVVGLLKSRGANINEPSEVGTPLMMALAVRQQERIAPPWGRLSAESDLLRIYHAFRGMGADLNAVDGQGNTLFHLAMAGLHRPLIEEMLASAGVDLNAPNKAGDTPFMNFVRGAGANDLDLIAHMIERGAKINARNNTGYAVILAAAFRPDLFDFLKQRGADVFVALSGGNTIWSELKYAPSPVVIGLADKLPLLMTPMKKDGKPGSGPLHVFTAEPRPDLVEYFLKRGVAPDERNDWRNTPLHMVSETYAPNAIASHKNLENARMLLDARADVNARNLSDETPLMKAGRQPPAFLQLLIAKGADVNAVAKSNGKEKHVLDYFSENANIDGFNLLVKAGASKVK